VVFINGFTKAALMDHVVFINGFTRAALMDRGQIPKDNNVLNIFVIGLIRTPRQYCTSNAGIGSTA